MQPRMNTLLSADQIFDPDCPWIFAEVTLERDDVIALQRSVGKFKASELLALNWLGVAQFIINPRTGRSAISHAIIDDSDDWTLWEPCGMPMALSDGRRH